jgi:hypothetical protein
VIWKVCVIHLIILKGCEKNYLQSFNNLVLQHFLSFLYLLKDCFIKFLHTLHALRLNLPNKIENFQSIRITELIWIDLVTCAKYYDQIKHFVFSNLSQKTIIFLGIFFIFFVTEFQNCGSEHDYELLWIKNAPMFGMHINEKIEKFVDMYISCDVSLLPNPLQNAQ